MGLCVYCKNVNLDILDHPERIKSRYGKRLIKFRPISKWNDQTCDFCNLLKALYLKQVAGDGQVGPVHDYSLYAYSYQKTFDAQQYAPSLAKVIDATVLSLVQNPVRRHRSPFGALSSPYLAPSSLFTSKKSTQRLNRLDPAVNINLIRDWLAWSEQNQVDHVTTEDQISDELNLLRLIDCNTRRIVNGDHTRKYVALSYVWGCGEAPDSSSDGPGSDSVLLPETLPNVLEDAIQVVRNLNLQYLWIDRYCILQNDALDKHNQIAKMDLIFKRSQLTIIAAAGSSPDHGLPGIGKSLRKPQMSRKVAKHTWLLIPYHPTRTVKQSHWNGRGWTYQEAIFSRRRLIFTDEEIYFECDGMSRRESVNIDPHVSKSSSDFDSSLSRTQSFPELNGTPDDILDHISEFSKRDLSYPSDVLNAMMGVFRSYEAAFGRAKATHHWGVPLVFPNSPSDEICLPWTAKLLYGLSWAHCVSNGRRKGFPSWSWTGWLGGVHFSKKIATFNPDPAIRVSVQIKESGLHQDFEDFMNQGLPTSFAFPHLFVDVWTVRLKFKQLSTNDFQSGSERTSGLYAGSKYDHKHHQHAQLFLDEIVPVDSDMWKRLLEQEWECIVLFHDDAQWHLHLRYVFLVCEWDGDTAKRIGLVSPEASSHDEETWRTIQDEFKKTWRTGIKLE
jgi:hypothetical protein